MSRAPAKSGFVEGGKALKEEDWVDQNHRHSCRGEAST